MRCGWMRPSSDQLLQRQPADLAADRVEAGQQHGLGGVVDDQVDAGDRLEGADVAALAADDAALHVVAGQVQHRRRRTRRSARWPPAGSPSVTILRARVSPSSLRLALDVAGEQGGLALGLRLDRGDQLGLGLLGGQAGDPLEHRPALASATVELGPLRSSSSASLLERARARWSARRRRSLRRDVSSRSASRCSALEVGPGSLSSRGARAPRASRAACAARLRPRTRVASARVGLAPACASSAWAGSRGPAPAARVSGRRGDPPRLEGGDRDLPGPALAERAGERQQRYRQARARRHKHDHYSNDRRPTPRPSAPHSVLRVGETPTRRRRPHATLGAAGRR